MSTVPSGARTGAPLLSIADLRVSFRMGREDGVMRRVDAVKGVSFELPENTTVALVGESGSGKSQTAFAILGILPPTARILGGQILFDGSDVLADPDFQRQIRGRRIGYIPQEPMANLDPSYTVGSQLNEGLRAATGVSKEAAKATLLALLQRVGIPNPARTYDAYPHQVSGGMAQRVLIAGAIASDPEFLIADEPTTALDVTVQADVLELLRELQAERGLGMVLVTHNFGVVADICDRVSVMRAGRIVESNTLDEIFANPQDPYTQMLLGSTLEGAPLRPSLSVAEEA
jgi:peptide/nickel transport system permease protein